MTNPIDTIAADIVNVLDGIPRTPDRTEDFDGDVEEVVFMAVREMGVRLKNNPDLVPANVLVKFVAEANRAAERRKDTEEPAARTLLLDRVDALPADHAKALIAGEIERLEGELERLKQKHSEL